METFCLIDAFEREIFDGGPYSHIGAGYLFHVGVVKLPGIYFCTVDKIGNGLKTLRRVGDRRQNYKGETPYGDD